MVNEHSNLVSKIYNKIILDNTDKDTYIINQEGKLFTCSIPYQHIKKYKNYIMGGKVFVFSNDFSGILSFDFEELMADANRYIVFSSNSHHSGNDFKEFYSKLINGNEQDFIWVNNLSVYNIKNQIKKIVRIKINNTKVDANLVKQICSLFPSLKIIDFTNCVIASDCRFISNHNIKINFCDCAIESTNLFIDSINDFNFIRCDFNQIFTSSITSCSCYSKKIHMFECDIDFYSLFLKTNFPDLEYLLIENIPKYDDEGNNFQRNLGNSFNYLPDACPNLRTLKIEASLDNIEFLSRLPFLESVSILSSSGVMDYPLLKLNDIKSMKKLEEKNNTRVRIKQILSGNQDEEQKEYFITESEIERVLELNAFYRTFYTTPSEANALIKLGSNYKDLLSYFLSNDFIKLDGYYENYFWYLIYRHLEEDPYYYITSTLSKLKYLHNALFYDKPKDKIVLAKNFLFYIDGIPILFDGEKKRKPIITEEEALEYKKNNPFTSFEYDETEEYLNQLRDYIESDEEFGTTNLTVSELTALMQSIDCDVPLDSLINNLDQNIICKLHKDDEKWAYKRHLRSVYRKCLKAFVDMINRNYSTFTTEELIIIVKSLPEENLYDLAVEFNCNPFFDINELNLDRESLIKEIDLKCNGNYTKLLKSINDIKELESSFVKKEPVLTTDELLKIKTLILNK